MVVNVDGLMAEARAHTIKFISSLSLLDPAVKSAIAASILQSIATIRWTTHIGVEMLLLNLLQ